MTKHMNWRKFLACAMVDAVLVCAAGAAWAAPTAPEPASLPTLPVLLMLGVGLVSFTWRRGASD